MGIQKCAKFVFCRSGEVKGAVSSGQRYSQPLPHVVELDKSTPYLQDAAIKPLKVASNFAKNLFSSNLVMRIRYAKY